MADSNSTAASAASPVEYETHALLSAAEHHVVTMCTIFEMLDREVDHFDLDASTDFDSIAVLLKNVRNEVLRFDSEMLGPIREQIQRGGTAMPTAMATAAAPANNEEALIDRDERAGMAQDAVIRLAFLIDSLMPAAIELSHRDGNQGNAELIRSAVIRARQLSGVAITMLAESDTPIDEARKLVKYGSTDGCYNLERAGA